MSDYNFHTEPIYSGETEAQYRARISNIDALKLASEKRIWERKKLAEINKAKVELTNVLEHMKNETITIEAPEGHVIDKENSTDTVIRFKKVESNKRPMSWLELGHIKGFYISPSSVIRDANCIPTKSTRDVWPTKELAEAALALSQLLQLRDAWSECNTEEVAGGIVWYGITNQNGKAVGMGSNYLNMPLRFKTEETRDAFLKQFRPLIETALPLL